MTVNSRVIKTFLAWSPDAVDVPLMNGLRVQILPTVDDIPRARKHQFAAFIASEALLVVWDDDPSHLVERAKSIEAELMQLVWQTGEATDEDDTNEKKAPRVTEYEVDQESGEVIPEKRATNLMNTILVGVTLIIVVTMLGAAWRALAIEVMVDKGFLRLAFVLLTPVQVFFTLVRPSCLPWWRSRLTVAVLCPSHRWLHCTMHRSCASNADEFKILLGQMLAPPAESNSTTHHSAMPRIQGRSGVCHCSYGEVNQASHLDLRASGRVCQHVRQR
jgi:hypothetical protein